MWHGRGLRQRVSLPSVPEHQEAGARHRPVPIAGDRACAWRPPPGGERAGPWHDLPRQVSREGHPMTKPLLLLVEDDEDIRAQMQWALKGDYDVSTASDRQTALAAFNSSQPAVTLLDL